MTAIKREERIGGQRLILGDCVDVMTELGRFDAVVTSPPYDGLRDYNETFTGVDCLAVIEGISRALNEGGVCMWNAADQTVNGSETGSSFRQALHAIECGMNLHDTMIYERAQVFGGSRTAYLHSFEYMFIFSSGPPKVFNAIRDRKNVRPGVESIAKSGRRKNGDLPERHRKLTPEFGKRTNIWRYGVGGENHGHPAVMPMKIAEDHIRTWTNEGETILDPFMGSGTTLVACQKLGRRGTGIEIDPEYFEIACRRVDEATRQPDLLIDYTPNVPVQEALFNDET